MIILLGSLNRGIARSSNFEILKTAIEGDDLSAVPWHAHLRNSQRFKRQNRYFGDSLRDMRENARKHIPKTVVLIWILSRANFQPTCWNQIRDYLILISLRSSNKKLVF